MKKVDEGKASLVEFLSSIRFARNQPDNFDVDNDKRFARFDQRVPVTRQGGAEDSYLVRSAN